MLRFSIIVTTYTCESTFASCLESIIKQDYHDFEVIVVDSSPSNCISDMVVGLPKVKYFKTNAVERSEKRNEGALKAVGDFVVVVDSDMILSHDVLSKCNNEYIKNNNIKLMCIPERSVGSGYWSNCKAMERSFYDKYMWMQAARVIRRETFLEFNGYNPKNVGSEDYELPRRIEYKYKDSSICMVPSFITQDEGCIDLYTQLRKKFMYAKSFHEYSKNHETKNSFVKQTSLISRYVIFFNNFRSGIRKPHVYIGVFVLKTLEFYAGGLGYVWYRIRNNES